MIGNTILSYITPALRPRPGFQATRCSIYTTSALYTDSLKARLINDHPPQAKAMRNLAHTGNPYETKITRKREVANLSYPNFENVECLKWTKWSMLKDVKRRHRVSEYWQYRNNLHSLAYTLALPALVREIALEDRNDVPKEAYGNRIVNRCAISSRARGRYKDWRMSRIVWRDLADHGMISGCKRAQWG